MPSAKCIKHFTFAVSKSASEMSSFSRIAFSAPILDSNSIACSSAVFAPACASLTPPPGDFERTILADPVRPRGTAPSFLSLGFAAARGRFAGGVTLWTLFLSYRISPASFTKFTGLRFCNLRAAGARGGAGRSGRQKEGRKEGSEDEAVAREKKKKGAERIKEASHPRRRMRSSYARAALSAVSKFPGALCATPSWLTCARHGLAAFDRGSPGARLVIPMKPCESCERSFRYVEKLSLISTSVTQKNLCAKL